MFNFHKLSAIFYQSLQLGYLCYFTQAKPKRTLMVSLRKQPSFFAPGPSGVSREGRLRFTAENSILMTQRRPGSGHER